MGRERRDQGSFTGSHCAATLVSNDLLEILNSGQDRSRNHRRGSCCCVKFTKKVIQGIFVNDCERVVRRFFLDRCRTPLSVL